VKPRRETAVENDEELVREVCSSGTAKACVEILGGSIVISATSGEQETEDGSSGSGSI
jgi:hypothetical protein